MKNITTLMAAALLVAGAAVSSAQETKPLGISVRAGVFMPAQRVARNEGRNWFGAGVEYKISDLSFASDMSNYNGQLSVSLDYFNKGQFRRVPLLLNYTGRVNEFYYVAGLGADFAKYRTVTGGPTTSKTELGYQLGFGYEFSKGPTPAFVEAKWLGSGRKELGGWGVFVGVRF